MIHLSYSDMHKLIEAGQVASQYAWEHFEELDAREAEHTLYGPASNFLGAASPCHLIRTKERKLLNKTRRERYTKYEMDADYQLIRVTHMFKHDQIDCTYHVFVLGSTTYACPFFRNEKKFYSDKVEAVKIIDGKAIYYAQTSPSYLYGEFYEYVIADKRMVSAYLYYPQCVKTIYQLPPSKEAPYGAPNSPTSIDYFEDMYYEIDPSKWLHKP